MGYTCRLFAGDIATLYTAVLSAVIDTFAFARIKSRKNM